MRIRLRVVSVVALFVIWQCLSWLINNPKLLPGIDYVLLRSLPSIAAFSGSNHDDYRQALSAILIHSCYTFGRIVIGLAGGLGLGLLIGMGVHFFRHTRTVNERLLTIIRSIPLFALIPLFLFWFGGREIGIYAYLIFSVSVIVATNTYEAICNLTPAYTYQASLMGANRYQLFRTVYAHAIQPEMIGGFRNVLGLTWAFSLGAEYLSATSGLGYLVYQSYLYSDMGKLIVFVLIYGFYGVAGYLLTKRLFDNLRKWHHVSLQEG